MKSPRVNGFANFLGAVLFGLLVLAISPGAAAGTVAGVDDRMPPITPRNRLPANMSGLTIVGYNYTDTYIGSFTVNGAGGGNIEVSSKTSGGGGGVCCAAIPAGAALPITIDIAWKRDGRVPWCRQSAVLDGPVPADPQYLEVHFFPDGSIMAALSDYPAPPRMQLERFSYVKRRPSGNVDNDERFGSCGHDH